VKADLKQLKLMSTDDEPQSDKRKKSEDEGGDTDAKDADVPASKKAKVKKDKRDKRVKRDKKEKEKKHKDRQSSFSDETGSGTSSSSSSESSSDDEETRKKKREKKAAKKAAKKGKGAGAGSSKAKDEEDDGTFDLGNKRKISVSKYKGKTLVDIREYYEKDGKSLPGRKGISLNPDQWKALIEHGPAVTEKIANM